MDILLPGLTDIVISLDHDQLKHYRPVSSLYFISKVAEKIVAARLSRHMQSHNKPIDMVTALRRHY